MSWCCIFFFVFLFFSFNGTVLVAVNTFEHCEIICGEAAESVTTDQFMSASNSQVSIEQIETSLTVESHRC